jgi:hypothetical protein
MAFFYKVLGDFSRSSSAGIWAEAAQKNLELFTDHSRWSQ